MARQYKYLSDESAVPTRWYNIVADLPNPPSPPLHPGTGQPLGPADLAPLFPKGIIEQELGDVLWYASQIATELDVDLDSVAAANLSKLASRADRGMLKGDGDSR